MTEQSAHARQSAVVLDLGAHIGALVVHTSAADDAAEIEISPGTDPNAPRSHNQVHPRRAPAGILYSAVYPSLTEGEYTLWRDENTVEAVIAIQGGRITEHQLSAPLDTQRRSDSHTGHTHSHG